MRRFLLLSLLFITGISITRNFHFLGDYSFNSTSLYCEEEIMWLQHILEILIRGNL